MAFIIYFFFPLKIFEKVEKTGFCRAKFFFHYTLSLILGLNQKSVSVSKVHCETEYSKKLYFYIEKICSLYFRQAAKK